MGNLAERYDNRVAVPVVIYGEEPLPRGVQASCDGGVLTISRHLTDVDAVIEIVREAILTMNGQEHRTRYVEKAGYGRGTGGVPRPVLEAHEGGGEPDRRRTWKPKLEVVR